MAASRTGTATYLRNRRRVLTQARADGLTHCPGYVDAAGVHHPCGVELDYDVPLLPNSAEADHILASRYAGTDDIGNLAVLCRKQNLEKGDGSRDSTRLPSPQDFPLSRVW